MISGSGNDGVKLNFAAGAAMVAWGLAFGQGACRLVVERVQKPPAARNGIVESRCQVVAARLEAGWRRLLEAISVHTGR